MINIEAKLLRLSKQVGGLKTVMKEVYKDIKALQENQVSIILFFGGLHILTWWWLLS